MQNKDEQISALVELNEELENYFGNTIIPQLFVDAALVLRKFTPPAMKQFKLKRENLGRPLLEVIDNFRFPTIIDNIEQVIDTGELLEKEIQTTDMKWYQMNILPYRERKKNTTNGVIITFVDITSRIKDLKDLEKLIAEHELLLDTIAHDIKNPLLALSMSIQLLKRAPEKELERFPSMLQNVENSLNKLKKIVYDLVETRWHEHRYLAVEEILDLENILEDVRLTLAPQIQSTQAIIKKDIGSSEVTFVRRKLRSVVYNLVNNALKYSSPGRKPEILIKSYIEPGYVVISVSDNGIGINRDNLDLIFNKHHRVESSGEGNGVGLYLVKEILETSGGKIAVESEPGKGSVFSLFLPLKDNPQAP